MHAALELVGLRPEIGTLLSVIALAFILKSGLVLLANKRVGYTVARVATDLRLELLGALLATRWSHYTRLPVGAVSNAIATEAARAAQTYLYVAEICAELVADGSSTPASPSPSPGGPRWSRRSAEASA